MTIAIGFKCMDGLVFAADSQYTEGAAKFDGQKIFSIPSNGHYALTVAGAGGVPSIKGAVREIGKALNRDVGPRLADLSELLDTVENALRVYYPKHIDSAPRGQRQDMWFSLLIGVWIRDRGTRLYETSRTITVEVEDHRSIGTGQWLTECLTDLFLPPGVRPPVDEAKAIAAYLVGRAKKYVQYCGGNTFVRALLDDGIDDRVWAEEIRDSEEYFEDFFLSLGHIRRFLRLPSSETADIAPFIKILEDRFGEFKAKRQACRDKQAAIRQRSASRRSSH